MYIYKNIITIEDGKRSGKPCIREMRITVNCSTDFLANLLNDKSDKIKAFLNNPEFTIYEILK